MGCPCMMEDGLVDARASDASGCSATGKDLEGSASFFYLISGTYLILENHRLKLKLNMGRNI
jgi:hypothetical protein